MILGFALSAYAIIANDSIQTLGTFLSSNSKRPWWSLWIWISGIMVVTVAWGWVVNGGDPAFGRLAANGKDILHPSSYGGAITWLFVIPPLSLVILTQMGIPVSTSLLVLTAFKGLSAAQQGKTSQGAVDLFNSMMQKSLVGYAIAFVLGLILYWAVIYIVERKVMEEADGKRPHNELHPIWTLCQWLTAGFLWAMWLIQDLANIFVYLPRELSLLGLVCSLGGMVLLQGYFFRVKGGAIQKVVTNKTNTMDVRSATFINLLYGLVLLFFKVDYIPKLFAAMDMHVPWPEKMPMSTTWVFLGLLAGREIGIGLHLKIRKKKKVSNMIFRDAGKAFLGSSIAVVLALFLPTFIRPIAQARLDSEAEAAAQIESVDEAVNAAPVGVQVPDLPAVE